jgi:hypothetical protein
MAQCCLGQGRETRIQLCPSQRQLVREEVHVEDLRLGGAAGSHRAIALSNRRRPRKGPSTARRARSGLA